MPPRFADGDLSERLTVQFDEDLVDELDELIESVPESQRRASRDRRTLPREQAVAGRRGEEL